MPVEPSQNKSSLSKSAFWLLLAKSLAFFFTLALPLLVVRRLTRHEYGLYKQAFLFVNTSANLLSLGFHMSAYYFLPREPERRGAVVVNIFLYCLVVGGLAGLALCLYPSLLALIFGGSDLTGYAPIIGLASALWLFGIYLDSVAVANQETKMATILIVGGSLSRTGLLLAAAIVFGTVKSLIWAAAVHGALQTVTLLAYLEVRFPSFWRQFSLKMLRTQLSYALPLGLAGILYTMQTDLHNYFVSHQLGTVAFATYSIGCFQLPLVAILSEAVASVLIPAVSLLEKRGETRRIIELIANAARKLGAVYFPVTALLAVVAHEFIVFLFTPRYEAAVPIFLVNLILFPFNALLTDPVVRAYAEFRYTLIRIRTVLFLVLCVSLWFGIVRFGAIGAIWVVVALSLTERLVTTVLLGRLVGVSRRDLHLFRDVGWVALAALAAAVVTAFLRTLLLGYKPVVILLVCSAFYGLAYLAAVVGLGIVTKEEWRRARGWWIRIANRARF